MNFLSKVCGTRTARIAFVVTIAIGLLPEALNAKSFKLKPTTIVPGATGEVKTGKDKNGNTKFNIKVKYMAEPAQLTPPKSVYVVWIQVKDGSPVSQGALKVDDKREGEFESTTPEKLFDLWITAESDATVQSPSGPEVLRANGVKP
jgi:hypothetical protein